MVTIIVSLLLFFVSQGMIASGQIKIIAHRGASFLAPENTVASAVLAWENSADAVECDIWLREQIF